MATEPETSDSLSYSYRARPETPADVWRNRIGMTATLFATAMASAFLLGRSRD